MVGTELHDRISQPLAVAKMRVDALGEAVSDRSLQGELDGIAKILSQTLDETRTLTGQLSYPALSLLGLSRAVEKWLQDEVSSKHGLLCHFSDEDLHESLDLNEDIKAILFRSVREALNNIVKHARARKVCVELLKENCDLLIRVTDDGIGFDTRTLREGGCGFGLLSISESLERMGGRLAVESRGGCGCQITLSVPAFAKDPSVA
jgi:signal transduction histidine kinase